MKVYFLLLLCLSLTLKGYSQPASYPYRTWTTITTNSTYARFLKQEDKTIHLETNNDGILKVHFDSLIISDQMYITWYCLTRTRKERMCKDIPDLLDYAEELKKTDDQKSYDHCISLVNSFISRNSSALELFKNKYNMRSPEFSRGAGLTRSDVENITAGMLAYWLTTKDFLKIPPSQILEELSTLIEEENQRSVKFSGKRGISAETNVRNNRQIEIQNQRDQQELEKKAYNRQIEMQNQLDQQALERKAARLEQDIDSGSGDSSYSSRARSLANEAQRFGNHNAGSKFSEASRKLGDADTDSYLRRSGMGDSFNSPSRKKEDAVRDLSSGRSNLKSSY
jgi:hypothetical protein